MFGPDFVHRLFTECLHQITKTPTGCKSGQQWKHSDYEGIVEPVPLEKPESIQSDQLESWRGFLYITRTYIGNSFVLDAVATDGTAWHFIQNPGEHAHWERTPDLPCE